MLGELPPLELVGRLEKVSGKTYNKDQRKAILHGVGPLWITAGPGSGKSEVLIARTLKLLVCDRISPASIILTTFTDKAAANLANRIASYLDDLGFTDEVDATDLRMGTLHSLCNTIMRDHRYPDYIDLELMDENSRMFFLYNKTGIVNFFKDNWKDFKPIFPGFFSTQYGPNRWTATYGAAFIFDRITEFRVDIEAMENSGSKKAKALAEIYRDYRECLLEKYRCDFSTLQEYFLRFLDTDHGAEFLQGDPSRHREPVTHILVDEFQDTNPIQEAIYFKIARKTPHNLTIVGDDDQALYRFRGGTVDSLVHFGDRCMHEWKVKPSTVNLHENHRSHPDIVRWFNNYISNMPTMRKPGVRAPGKREMVPKSKIRGSYPAVCACWDRTLREAAGNLTDFLVSLKRRKIILDWKDVGILLKSTRESPQNAAPFVEALRAREIPVYNPRNRALHQDLQIQQLLGALIATLDEDFKTLETIKGRVVDEIRTWVEAYKTLARSKEGQDIAEYVRKSQKEIDRLEKAKLLNTTVMDVLYRILAHKPFRELKENPNYATRFAILTDLIDSYTAFTEGYGLLRASSSEEGRLSFTFLTNFYYQFSGFIQAYGLNEPENPEDLMPAGFVQVMTVHQAKGLEFPIVVVGSLNDKPWVSGDSWTEDFLAPWTPRKPMGMASERAEQDLIRRFYVAYSRAKNLLILCGKDGIVTSWALGDWNGK